MAFEKQDMQDLLNEIYAEWVQELNISPVKPTDDGYEFILPKNKKLVRDGDVLCGQAIAAVSDSVGVLSLSYHGGKFRPMTTTQLSTNFVRPLFLGDIRVITSNIASGKSLATTRVDFMTAASGTRPSKVGATSMCHYAYLDNR